MKTAIFDFDIPEELIAKYPSKKRSDSRLLVDDRLKDKITDSYTKNITDFIDENYFLVFNNSRVIPARLEIIRERDKRKGEILVLKIIDKYTVEALTDKAKKYQDNTFVILPGDNKALIAGTLEDGVKIIKSEIEMFSIEYFDKYGLMPLPPERR